MPAAIETRSVEVRLMAVVPVVFLSFIFEYSRAESVEASDRALRRYATRGITPKSREGHRESCVGRATDTECERKVRRERHTEPSA
jgi:hypothetical protein